MARISSCAVTLLLSGLVCCKAQRSEPRPEPAHVSSAPALSAAASAPLEAFGAPIDPAPVLSLADVLATPERFRDRVITVQGHVRSACTRRGCWMELATADAPKLAGCRVTFKDYGFFVPTDSAGAEARVQGVLSVNTLPPERVTHLESEGGQFPNKNPDGSVAELRLVATGVELWR